ncbi:MAG: transposase [Oscillospiraceae bacterium]|nr:transposase [Oscillospiraceae bacterium]MBQ9719426.1 transposase [Oscillospiraceae bacterium]
MSGGKLTRNTTIKYRLYPSPEQAALLDKTFASCRWLWNAILADEQEFFAATDKHYLPTPARYKKEAPFLKEVDSQALVTVHQTLRRAFQDFFDGKSGYPRFKPRYSRDAYTVYCQHYDAYPDSVRLTDEGVRLPKVGNVRARLHRKPLHWWTTVAATVSKSQSGNYYCSILYSYDAKEPEPVEANRVGEAEANEPATLAKAEARLAAMEQKLSRMTQGSKNYERQRKKLAAQREHIANIKSDHAHKESRKLADAYDAVRADGTDSRLRENLRYKLERQGKTLIE